MEQEQRPEMTGEILNKPEDENPEPVTVNVIREGKPQALDNDHSGYGHRMYEAGYVGGYSNGKSQGFLDGYQQGRLESDQSFNAYLRCCSRIKAIRMILAMRRVANAE